MTHSYTTSGDLTYMSKIQCHNMEDMENVTLNQRSLSQK